MMYAQMKRLERQYVFTLPSWLVIPMRPEDFFCFWMCQHRKRLTALVSGDDDEILKMYLKNPEVVEDRHN